jgi:RHS repeat-associated protein
MVQRRSQGPRRRDFRTLPFLSVLGLSLVATMVVSPPGAVQAQAARQAGPVASSGSVSASVPGRGAPKVPAPADPDKSAPPLATPSYPAAQSATVAVPVAGGAPVKLGGLPVTVAASDSPPSGTGAATPNGHPSAPRKVAARSLDHGTAAKFGAGTAMAMVLSRADGQQTAGPIRVTIDYAQFAQASGANYADRLRVVTLPTACASMPTGAACTNGTPVAADNNTTTKKISASVNASPSGTMIVLDAASSGETGDFRATDLNVAQTWQAGEPGGAFAYSYPIDVPDPPYGDAPDLSLDYDSATVDGRTSRSNNQASWVGLGWDINIPYIERQYSPCADDGHSTWGDLCWKSPYSDDPAAASYVISINGHTSELIKAADGSYRMKDDQEYRIEHHTGGPNGDNDGEYWIVSTLDGTQYFFGYGQDQRRSTPTPTNSNWTVPVVSDDAGEPCHQSDLASCQQTYRWNVDEVHSPNEVYQVYFYDTDTNTYKRASSGNILSYIRDGYLAKIEYGKVFTADAPAPAYVEFTHFNRCTQRVAIADPDATAEPTCPTQASSPNSYPDVPTDLLCSSSCSKHSPSFFESDMLDSIQAYVQNTSGGYDEVTKWQLKHSFPTTDDGTNPSLWLDYVREIGFVGGRTRDAVTSFDGTNLNNRVDFNTSLGVPPLSMRRLAAIHNVYGGETDVVYGHQHGCFTKGTGDSGWNTFFNSKNGHWDTNTDECFPQFFKPEGADAGFGIFHKYVVKSVTEVDHVGDQPNRVTTYTYNGGPGGPNGAAWHHDDAMLLPDSEQSYGDWRGYGTVEAVEGSGSNAEKTVTDTTYFRGMSANVKVDGTTPAVSLTDYDGNKVDDAHFLEGLELQQQKFRLEADGVTKTELSGERWTYADVDGITANGPGLHNAHVVRPAVHLTRDRLDNGTFRISETDDTYDPMGLVKTETDKGDTAVSTDDVCTTTTYARNTTEWRWMINYPETVERHEGSCTGTLLGRTVTLYDNATSTDATVNMPIDGNPTEVRSYTDDRTYSAADKTYDDEGRVLTATDPLQHKTTTTYTPLSGYPTGGVKVTNALGQLTTTFVSPAFGGVTKEVDVNGRITERAYDAFGRVTAVWLASEPRGDGTGTPSYSYSYVTPAAGISPPTGPTVVTTKQLQSDSGSSAVFLTSYEYQDGFAEPIETQTASPQAGGREVTVTRYDSRGLETLTSKPFFNSSAPGSGLLNPAENAIPTYTTTSYDSLEQQATQSYKAAGVEQFHTTTADHGDHTVTVPPSGGQVVTWTDVFDKPTKVQNYVDATTHQDTTYTYTPDHQNLASVTDPNGNVTSYVYDFLGHQLTANDPDSGKTVSTYDLAGNVTSVTDGKQQKVSTAYDELNRATSTWLGDVNTGTQLTALTYDTVLHGIGQLASSTTFAGGQSYVDEVTSYDNRYRVTGRRYTIPTAEAGLGGSYDFSYTYDKADHQTSMTYPAAGGLPGETVTENYTTIGLPNTVSSPLDTYVASTSFLGNGQLAGRQYSPAVERDYTYEPTTDRLATIKTVVDNNTVQNDQYSYDGVDNVTAITDHVANQTQCFVYDGRNRLTSAYTNGTDCTHTADTTGPAPYDLAYTYDGAGNITTSSSNGSTTTYTYPTQGAGAVRPHAVSGTDSSSGGNTYGYDANGDLATRTVGGTSSTLNWDANHQLAGITTAGKTTSFVYDAGGDRLLRRDPGATTLFLDNTELTSTGGGAPVATRYYSTGADGAVVAERTPAGLTRLAADTQGSEQLAVSSTGAVSRQLYLPYGTPRGATNQIPGDRGFLGKTQDDTTGLDLLDARYYDPSIGRFLSPDPLDNNDTPEAANPYAYAGDNPTTFSDPSGLFRSCGSITCNSFPTKKKKSSSGSHHSSGGGGGSSRHHSSGRTSGHIGNHYVFIPPSQVACKEVGCGLPGRLVALPAPGCAAVGPNPPQCYQFEPTLPKEASQPPQTHHQKHSTLKELQHGLHAAGTVLNVTSTVVAFCPLAQCQAVSIAAGLASAGAFAASGDSDSAKSALVGTAFNAALGGFGRVTKVGRGALRASRIFPKSGESIYRAASGGLIGTLWDTGHPLSRGIAFELWWGSTVTYNFMGQQARN